MSKEADQIVTAVFHEWASEADQLAYAALGQTPALPANAPDKRPKKSQHGARAR